MKNVEVTGVTDSDEAMTAAVKAEIAAPPQPAALCDNMHFTTSAVLGSDTGSYPRRLEWMTGHNDAFAVDGKTALPRTRGWYIQKPDEDEMYPEDYCLADVMEVLCAQGLASECIVVHPGQDNGGPSRRVAKWHLSTASLFVVCEGIPTIAEMQSNQQYRLGIAYGWSQANSRSVLSFRCFIKELMEAGYNGVFEVSFSGYVTPKAVRALKAQEDVLRFANQLRWEANLEGNLPYYAYALPLGVSTNTVTAGSGVKSSEVYYPYPIIPRLSLRTEELATASLSWLAGQAITETQLAILEHNGRVEAAMAWSVAETRRLSGAQVVDAAVEQAPF